MSTYAINLDRPQDNQEEVVLVFPFFPKLYQLLTSPRLKSTGIQNVVSKQTKVILFHFLFLSLTGDGVKTVLQPLDETLLTCSSTFV